MYTSILLFFPWGLFLLIYFYGITPSNLFLFNAVGLLVAILGHAVIVVYAIRRRNKLDAGSLRGAEANP